MAMMNVGASRHGDSLPAELRVGDELRGSPYFGLARLGIGLLGLTAPRGMRGIGDDGDTSDDTDGLDLTGDTGIVLPLPGLDENGNPIVVAGIPTVSQTLDSLNQLGPPLTSLPGELTPPAGYTGPTVLGASSATPAAPAGYQWATLANQAGQTLAKVLAVSQGGSSVTLPNGTQLLYGSATAAANAGSVLSSSSLTATLGSMAPLLLIGCALFLVVSMSRK
jgi:hypothetical protein